MRRRAFLQLGALGAAASLARRGGADALTDLRKGGVLRVGTSDDYPPFVKSSADGRAGLDVELARLLARALGVRVEFVPFKWTELGKHLDEMKFDVAASGVTMRADRLRSAVFSRPYAVTGAVLCVRREDASRFARAPTEYGSGLRIAVNRGGHLAHVARTFFPRATLELLDDNSVLFERVTTGAADAAVSDSAEAHAAAGELVTLPALTRDRKALYLRSESKALARRLDEVLFALEVDGSLPRLRRKWLGDVMPADWNPHLEAVLADLQLRFDVMPGVGTVKRELGKPVEDKEQETRVLAHVRDMARAAQLDEGSLESLWTVLMTSAKVIQLAPVSPDEGTWRLPLSPTGELDAFRAAIGALDEHLLASLKKAASRVAPAAWQPGVETGIRAKQLPKELLHRLSEALAAVHPAGHKASRSAS
jgi:cyclohexadienyl dehydratase